jgi:hypothetical protein
VIEIVTIFATRRYRAYSLASGRGDSLRDVIHRVTKVLLVRFGEFRYQHRFWRADQGIALVLVIGTLLGVGVLAATAVTRPDKETPFAQSSAAQVSSPSRIEVVTETVERNGGPARVVRRRPGMTVEDLVTLPGRTIRETHTVTMREVATVTAIQPVTVTVFETVTCKPKSC